MMLQSCKGSAMHKINFPLIFCYSRFKNLLFFWHRINYILRKELTPFGMGASSTELLCGRHIKRIYYHLGTGSSHC